MMNRYCLQIGVILIAALLLIGGPAQATPVAVNNAGFDNQTLDDGAASSTIADWTFWSSSAGAGLVCNPTGYDAPGNDTAWGFMGASGNGTPLGGNGANVAWEFENDGQYGIFQQVLDTTLQVGYTYTLTAALGKVPTGGNICAQLLIGLEDVPGSLTTLQVYSPVIAPEEMTSAEFVDRSVSFTVAAGNPYVGQKLMIGLCGYAPAPAAGSRSTMSAWTSCPSRAR